MFQFVHEYNLVNFKQSLLLIKSETAGIKCIFMLPLSTRWHVKKTSTTGMQDALGLHFARV